MGPVGDDGKDSDDLSSPDQGAQPRRSEGDGLVVLGPTVEARLVVGLLKIVDKDGDPAPKSPDSSRSAVGRLWIEREEKGMAIPVLIGVGDVVDSQAQERPVGKIEASGGEAGPFDENGDGPGQEALFGGPFPSQGVEGGEGPIEPGQGSEGLPNAPILLLETVLRLHGAILLPTPIR